MLTVGDDGWLVRWNAVEGSIVDREWIRGGPNVAPRGDGYRHSLALSPVGVPASAGLPPEGGTPTEILVALGTWGHLVKLFDAESLDAVGSLATGHTWAVTSIAVSSDGRTFATAGWDDLVKVWDTATGHERATLAGHQHKVQCVAISPDGERIASASWDKTARVWDVQNGQQIARWDSPAGEVVGIAFSPDGRWLAYGTRGVQGVGIGPGVAPEKLPRGRVVVRQTSDWQEIATLDGSDSVVFSPDGRFLATGSERGDVILHAVLSETFFAWRAGDVSPPVERRSANDRGAHAPRSPVSFQAA